MSFQLIYPGFLGKVLLVIAAHLELLGRLRCIYFMSSISEEGFIIIAIRLELCPSSIDSRLRRTSLEFLKKISL